MHVNGIRKLASLAIVLAFCVVMLGAYTRLTDAGLGCPDWPGCYGHLVLPSADTALQKAQTTFPAIPIESTKAWTEMAHRYLAGTLGILIFILGIASIRKKVTIKLPIFLMIFVVFQALLGMWTVTLKLLPIVVMSHLLGGIIIFASLVLLRLKFSDLKGENTPQWIPWIGLAIVLVFFQIALGGWVSANYAGIACIGFPQCNGVWFPSLHLKEGFYLFSPVGANYQGGLLENEVRITIQFIHRMGAVIVASYLFILCTCILRFASQKGLRILAAHILLLVTLQWVLGILNVMYLLPVVIAVAHNGVAALLFASVVSLLYFTKRTECY